MRREVVWVVGIVKPLLQLVVAAYLHRGELAQSEAQRVLQAIVLVEYCSRTQCLCEHVEGYLVVHGAATGSGHALRSLLLAGTMFR